MREDWPRLLVKAASGLGIALNERQVDLFVRYRLELSAWNEKINLFSRSLSDDDLLGHFSDSLTAAAFLPHKESAVLDMGSGGGLPGIPLKIAVPTLNISLLEASRKKTSFLKHAIRTLQLTEMTVIHGRAEKLIKEERCGESFSVVISKAAFNLPDFLRLGAFFLAPGGLLIAMKGMDINQEMKEAEPAAAVAGLHLSSSQTLVLPLTGNQRMILIYKKAK
jgi:16S rRNA (guanine527-N7)-methyltransferase